MARVNPDGTITDDCPIGPPKKPNEDITEKAMNYLRKGGITDVQINGLVVANYFSAPASRRNHLAREGGLALHSIHVTDQLLALKVFETERAAYRVGMLHDLVKAFTYMRGNDSDGTHYVKVSSWYPGHGIASVFHCEDIGINLSPEERQAIIWHMGAFAIKDSETNAAYDQAKLIFPRQIVMTHAADHLATVLEDYEERHRE